NQRVLDYLNKIPARFVQLYTAQGVIFINRGRVVYDGEPAAMRERWESLDAAFHALTNGEEGKQ
ncbi:MAG: hypothetical protein JNL62_20040, partial [Bryobacterales bacterium]|nr:hypothetical protein [Bryobacterales bacterium]